MRNQTLEKFLPRLVQDYNHGRLAPFLGAGMSAGWCRTWGSFVDELERLAGILPASKRQPPEQRSARAVQKLKLHHGSSFPNIVRKAVLRDDVEGEPSNSLELAQLRWPLVLTTNYDDWFFAQWNQKHLQREPLPRFGRIEVVGRADSDCYRVVNSLRYPDNPLLWALHGFLRCQNAITPNATWIEGVNWRSFEHQLVIGHAEYRKQIHNALVFRRTFAEVFRSRSFLFLGTSLTDPHFLGLFDEILELMGPIGHIHYAMVRRGTVDKQQLRDRFNIECIEYASHDDVPKLIRRLRDAIFSTQPRHASWTIRLNPISPLPPSGMADLELSRGTLPDPSEGSCTALSAGGAKNALLLGRPGQSFLVAHFPTAKDGLLSAADRNGYIFRYGKLPVFLVKARVIAEGERGVHDYDRRHATEVVRATEALIRCAARSRFASIDAMLLSAGEGRDFPPHVALIQMIRGYARLLNSHRHKRLPKLSIHVVDHRVLELLDSERLDIAELLLPDVRFWIEVHGGDCNVVRFATVEKSDATLLGVLRQHNLLEPKWAVSVFPTPAKDSIAISTSDLLHGKDAGVTLEDLGIFPGSTLRVWTASKKEN
jgi:hypothetical protein